MVPRWHHLGDRSLTWPRDDHIDLVTLKPDGSEFRWLTNDVEAEMMPAWSPNGGKIAFSKNAGGGNGELFVIGASGGNPVQLTDKFAPDDSPSWSPDGARIVFTSNVRGIIDIYAMDADGSNIRQITNGGYDEGAVWSPVDEVLAFIRKPSHQNSEVGDIYLVRPDGRDYSGLRVSLQGGATSLGRPMDNRSPTANRLVSLV